jgi:chorismate lyase/3-hydroxybenzoate synthase
MSSPPAHPSQAQAASSAAAPASLSVLFGADSSELVSGETQSTLRLRIPALVGDRRESLSPSTGQKSTAEQEGAFSLVKSRDFLAGACLIPVTGHDLEAVTAEVYRQMFGVLRASPCMRLYRVWNYVPFINQETGGLENYRHFNVGRWDAFQDFFGGDSDSYMPAASAVGIADDVLAVTFQAGTAPVTYIENPKQVPAYEYPQEHGPRPPSFSRGAVVSGPNKTAYLSGTASVKGHQTVARSSLDEQLCITLDNVTIVREKLGVNGSQLEASWRAYVRDPQDAAEVANYLTSSLSDCSHENLLILRAEICRAPLRVEVEGLFQRCQW